MRCLSGLEMMTVNTVVRECHKFDKINYDMIIVNLKEILSIYCRGVNLEDYVDDETLVIFAKNFNKCKVKADELNFNISYKSDKKKMFVRANCLSDIIFGTEELSKVDENCSFLALEGDPVVRRVDIVGGRNYEYPLRREYKIGPLSYLDGVICQNVKKSCMSIENIEFFNQPTDWPFGDKQLYSYDFSSSVVKKNGKEMVKNAGVK